MKYCMRDENTQNTRKRHKNTKGGRAGKLSSSLPRAPSLDLA